MPSTTATRSAPWRWRAASRPRRACRPAAAPARPGGCCGTPSARARRAGLRSSRPSTRPIQQSSGCPFARPKSLRRRPPRRSRSACQLRVAAAAERGGRGVGDGSPAAASARAWPCGEGTDDTQRSGVEGRAEYSQRAVRATCASTQRDDDARITDADTAGLRRMRRAAASHHLAMPQPHVAHRYRLDRRPRRPACRCRRAVGLRAERRAGLRRLFRARAARGAHARRAMPEHGECVLLFGKHAPQGRIDAISPRAWIAR